MAQRKQRNKLKPASIEKIRARYATMYEKFEKLPLYDELEEDGVTVKVRGLRTIFREGKVDPNLKNRLSETDKAALMHNVDARMRKQMQEIAEKAEKDEEEARQANSSLEAEENEKEKSDGEKPSTETNPE